ncbi:MAG: succinyldiaminopimelate transaminase [Microbacteriaceae bacterium]|nr:succinyldiaminopimelate transaminase [Microbacteriaceae bacterium]
MLQLPDFPWDTIGEATARARSHPDGFIDLSVGSPVDPTPSVIADALVAAVDAHGYPATVGTPALREAVVDWFARRRGVDGLTADHVLPTIGSKELIALLPLTLGLGPGDVVVHPSLAYPTYEVGAAAVGATAVASDDPAAWPESTKLIWINSPGNPDGRVLDVPQLRAAVARARELGAVIVGDECYAELNWAGPDPTPSILDPRVVGDSRSGVLAVYSLSKQSNLAGYRAGIVAGCRRLIADVLSVRKNLGLMVPQPVQAAMAAAFADDAHVQAQRERYRERRRLLQTALERAGFVIDESSAGLYLWVSRGESSRETLALFAGLGILVAPGDFYGAAGARHVRVALTATDAAIRDAAARLELLA